ncbi:multiple sugar transport system permease protein [Anaerotaenia torta]|uniref:carbohydrate ABC transporter permease n=1 Tax=Anaerotaenia torta TaxID=433293 RepID=UPI003D1E35A3
MENKQWLRKIKLFFDHHSIFWLQLPFAALFLIFIIIPVVIAIGLSFTDFNSIESPNLVGLGNYVNILTDDAVFMENAIPNTVQFSVIVGVGGYLLSFFLAWSLAQITKVPRTIMAIILYLPSMTSGIMLSTVWQVVFAGDKVGYLNALLLKMDVIQKPILWLSDSQYLLLIMIAVSLWSSMGVGFLAMLAGILNVNRELYEAAYLDGVKNRFQEIIYVTVPAIRPFMMFGAVMSIVSTFQNGSIGVMLSGSNPTPGYAGQLLVTHAEEYAFVRYEMGYGAALSVIILIFVWGISQIAKKLFMDKD